MGVGVGGLRLGNGGKAQEKTSTSATLNISFQSSKVPANPFLMTENGFSLEMVCMGEGGGGG